MKRYISGKSRYIRYTIDYELFNPLHFCYIKSYSRYIIVGEARATWVCFLQCGNSFFDICH